MANEVTVVKTTFDAGAAKTAGNVGIATAGAHNAPVLEAAKAIAVELGRIAPITVDNVTKRLIEAGYPMSRRNTWKGGIFKSKEWVCIGSVPSTMKTSHGRPVRMWALKSWLANNKLNGMRLAASAFDLVGIYHEFRHTYDITTGQYKWLIGKSQLSNAMQDTIKQGDGKLFGIPVEYVDTAVGAVLTKATPVAPGKIDQAAFSRPDLDKTGKAPW